MKLSPTLSGYIGRQFLTWFGVAFGAFAAIVLLFDTIELLRRASVREQATFGIVVEMAVLKLPHMALLLVPFAILFGGMFAFWRLTRSHELVVARAAGISVWQFLLPALSIAFAVGAMKVMVLAPFSSIMLGRFEDLENTFLKSRPSTLAVSTEGLWLRQIERDGQSLIHAQRVVPEARRLEEVIVFRFRGPDRFVSRVDASAAVLGSGSWELRDVWVTVPGRQPERRAAMTFDTDLTWRKIEESFASPETMSFWELPGFITTLEAAGFSALRHRLYYHGLLASPLLQCAMVLIAAT